MGLDIVRQLDWAIMKLDVSLGADQVADWPKIHAEIRSFLQPW